MVHCQALISKTYYLLSKSSIDAIVWKNSDQCDCACSVVCPLFSFLPKRKCFFLDPLLIYYMKALVVFAIMTSNLFFRKIIIHSKALKLINSDFCMLKNIICTNFYLKLSFLCVCFYALQLWGN